MNYIKRLSIFAILLLSVIAVYAGGIKDAQQLVAFVTAINEGGDYSAFKNDKGAVCLEADIDMSKVKKFQSIKSFGGTFDGVNHFSFTKRRIGVRIFVFLDGNVVFITFKCKGKA